MSSADKKEYGELEQSMWRRFQDAEAMPDPDVWSRIDHELTLLENAKYKKRVLFYRQLAAACFTLFILAGAALLLHFKQDKEQALLAAGDTLQPAANSTTANASTSIASSQTLTEANKTKSATIGTQPAQAYTPDNTAGTQAIAQASGNNYTYSGDDNGYTSGGNAPVTYRKRNYNTGSGNPGASVTESGSQYSGTQLAATTGNTTTGVLTDAQGQGYVPASQAIANVPDNYSSSGILNPLLRRNAQVGTIASDISTQEVIAAQKQSELSLALNNPADTEKQEKASSSSRWNMGMGVTSSYFTQNVDIPEQRLMAMNKRSIGTQTGPIISADTEVNLIDAYKEFEENTQAANSINFDAKAGLRVGKRIKMLAGLGYSKNTSKTRTSYIVEQFVFNPRTSERAKLNPTTVFLPSLHTFTTDSVSVVKTKQPFNVDYSYQMLSVPLGVQVEGAVGQKWFWYAHGGGAANLMLQSTVKADNPEIATVSYGPADDSPFRKVQFSGNVGLGLGKRLSNAVSVSVGPEYRHFFSSLLASEYANAKQGKPYTIGVNMSINYMLGQNAK
ncbi:hypothetical protein WG947_12975 [Pontibacter sp. H259]|uniref:hypothetical protein n=1 Tax=Pontibacter sp. H259 TaxID=3133421 RepID=UPI0030C6050C